MLTNILGYPRMGAHRELKRAVEAYWKGLTDRNSLLQTAAQIRKENWQLMKKEDIDLIPSADFSLYDHVLSTCLMFGAIPARYDALRADKLDLFFAMAHGKQSDGVDVIAMEMTKWFDTNYHYIVPEFDANTNFSLFDNFVADSYKEALALGIKTKPVILGPATFLLLGKIRNGETSLSALADKLIPVYNDLLDSLADLGAEYVQIDEPLLVTDLDQQAKELFSHVYNGLTSRKRLKVILATYFDGIYDNAPLATSLGADFIHVDLVAAPDQLDAVIDVLPPSTGLSVGIVEGRNIWKNDFEKSLNYFRTAENLITEYDDRAVVSMRDAASEGAMAVTNLNALPYRGFCRDRILLAVYKSLGYLGCGKEDSFRAQLRRLRDEQKKIMEDYQKFFDEEQKSFQAIEKKQKEQQAAAQENADTTEGETTPVSAEDPGAESAGKSAGGNSLSAPAEKKKEELSQENAKKEQSLIEKNSQNKEFKESMDEMKRVANRGYGSFLNPLAIFLSGLGSVRDDNYENARIDFRRLYEAMPGNSMIQRYYVTVLKEAGREIPENLKHVKPFDFPLGRDCVIEHPV